MANPDTEPVLDPDTEYFYRFIEQADEEELVTTRRKLALTPVNITERARSFRTRARLRDARRPR